MKLLRILCTVSLILSAVPLHAQLFEDKPKKQAKELYEKATQEGSDHALQVKDSCQAAQLQPKEKKYSDACNSYRATMIHDDETALQSALLAYQSHDLEKAEILASKVSNTDAKLFSRGEGRFQRSNSIGPDHDESGRKGDRGSLCQRRETLQRVHRSGQQSPER